jgi:very-short-patch-repair endonuclease
MNPILLNRARQLRKNQTDTEKYLWYLLWNNDVLQETESVVSAILRELGEM